MPNAVTLYAHQIKSKPGLPMPGGMYLQVSPAGSKRWFLKYRMAGVEKQLSLGGYPAVTVVV